MNMHDAFITHRQAKFATDWAKGLVIYAERESLDILQPVEFDALENARDDFERAEVAACEELDFAEAQARSLHLSGGSSTPSRYL